MSTLVNKETRDRLSWIAQKLQKLYDNLWIRSEGEQDYHEACAELDNIIATADEPVTVAGPTVYNVLAEEKVLELVARVDAAIGTVVKPEQVEALKNAVMAAIIEQAEASDVAVMSAITQSQGEVIEAVNAAAAPAA